MKSKGKALKAADRRGAQEHRPSPNRAHSGNGRMRALLHFFRQVEPMMAFVVLIVTILTVAIALKQLEDSQDSTSELVNSLYANTVLQIMDSKAKEIRDPENAEIADAIAKGIPLRKAAGGKFSDAQIEHYLKIFEFLGLLRMQNENLFVIDDLFCESFFDYIQEAWNNKQIQTYLKEKRRTFPAFLGAFDSIAEAGANFEICPEFN